MAVLAREGSERGASDRVARPAPGNRWELGGNWFTGTGFPRVFYLKYHLYRLYFPLTALARYRRLNRE